MPRSTISVEISRNGQTLRSNEKFAEQLYERIQEIQAAIQEAYMREFANQIRTRVVPAVKARSQRRTGRLSRSIRSATLANGTIATYGNFYGAFNTPSTRRILHDVVRQYHVAIRAASINAARNAVQG